MNEFSLFPRSAWNFILKNPNMGLAALLFIMGILALPTNLYIISGALFGAGASLLGVWMNELRARRSKVKEKARTEADARRCFAAELNRTIERVLYIHGRVCANYTGAVDEYVSVKSNVSPNDLQADFLSEIPVLYPSAPQFRELSGDDATALIAFYDSLHALNGFVADWWERKGQLPVNIFNQMLHLSGKSLTLALVCIQRFDLEKRCPPPYEAWGSSTFRIEQSLSSAKDMLEEHIARIKAHHKQSNLSAQAADHTGWRSPTSTGHDL